jgi:hypothetical protein
VCDLQGAQDPSGTGFILTNPVVMSKQQDYGVADLGREGIMSWFENHVCNEYCQPEWNVARQQRYFNLQQGTLFRVKLADGSDDATFVYKPPPPPPPTPPPEASEAKQEEIIEEDDENVDWSENVYTEEFDSEGEGRNDTTTAYDFEGGDNVYGDEPGEERDSYDDDDDEYEDEVVSDDDKDNDEVSDGDNDNDEDYEDEASDDDDKDNQ